MLRVTDLMICFDARQCVERAIETHGSASLLTQNPLSISFHFMICLFQFYENRHQIAFISIYFSNWHFWLCVHEKNKTSK